MLGIIIFGQVDPTNLLRREEQIRTACTPCMVMPKLPSPWNFHYDITNHINIDVSELVTVVHRLSCQHSC